MYCFNKNLWAIFAGLWSLTLGSPNKGEYGISQVVNDTGEILLTSTL